MPQVMAWSRGICVICPLALPALPSLMKPELNHYHYWSPNGEAQPCLPFHFLITLDFLNPLATGAEYLSSIKKNKNHNQLIQNPIGKSDKMTSEQLENTLIRALVS